MKRTHRLYEPLVGSSDLDSLRSTAQIGALAAARFEPASRLGKPIGWLDLVFAREGHRAIAPLIAVDLAMLIEPEDEALVWPREVAARIGSEILDAIAARLYPWLYAASLLHSLDREVVRAFAEGNYEPEIARARDLGMRRSRWSGALERDPLGEPRAALFGRPPVAIGGSSGRIALAGRSSRSQAPDADTDEVLELDRRLRAEGFEVDRVSAGADLSHYDLVHVVGTYAAEECASLLEAARALEKPTVLTAGIEDISAAATWGMAASRSIFALAIDQRELVPFLRHLEARSLNLPGMNAGERHELRPGFEANVRRGLEIADVVLVNSPGEERIVRERFGRVGAVELVGPYVNTEPTPVISANLAGGEFVLCHAPIEPRANQLMLALAAREAGLPLVLLGPVVDASYAELVGESLGSRSMLATADAPGEVRAFYARARVFADAAWVGLGNGRIAQAAAYGCALAVANLRPGWISWPGVWAMDPASLSSLAAGLRHAWDGARTDAVRACAERCARTFDPGTALATTVSAYAQASASRLNNLVESAET